MKNLLCLFTFENRGSRGPCLPPPPCAPCLKTPSSESLRFCTSTAPTYPGPIRGNPKLRPGTAASRLGKAEPQPPLPGQCNTMQRHPDRCTVLQRVEACFAPNVSGLTCNTSTHLALLGALSRAHRAPGTAPYAPASCLCCLCHSRFGM